MSPLLLLLAAALAFEEPKADSPRKITSLNGEWRFIHSEPGDVSPPEKDWKKVIIPQAWQHHEGMDFHGIGWYEKTLDKIDLPKDRRLLLHFDAVATHAMVYWNGERVAEHLGPWTPFRADVTEQVRKKPAGPHIIRVRVDERVGHNTQGFLPIIQPHFGGIWQEAKLIEVPAQYFDDLRVAVHSDVKAGTMTLEIPIVSHSREVRWLLILADQEDRSHVSLSYQSENGVDFCLKTTGSDVKIESQYEFTLKEDTSTIRLTFKPGGNKPSPSGTTSNAVGFQLLNQRREPEHHFGDKCVCRGPYRTIETKGDQFLLNGQPLSIRGVLNWGYYPPNLAPNVDPEVWRADLKLIKSWGFNLMKCCLWVPPKRLLDIADEEGVLIWMEYPAWHPQFTPEFLPALEKEYAEFFYHDRNHPSVILRSLTCETGHGADIKVIQKLTDTCKRMIPGALVEDDSSWIEWNRVTDFYDDHPYGNNHTWVATLNRLKGYIAKSKLGVKPLILGEAIAADTWYREGISQQALGISREEEHKVLVSRDGKMRPYYEPIFADANREWLNRMEDVIGGPVDQKRLTEDSLRYAWLMRKYQIETFRREVPSGGYVVSVMRDFPLAGMGLIGYDGKPKWEARDWAWHGEKKSEGKSWPKMRESQTNEDYWPDNAIRSHPDRDGRIRDFLFKSSPEKPYTINPDELWVTPSITEIVLKHLDAGGKVLLLPDGKAGSPPLQNHWFLRGGPFVNVRHPLFTKTPELHQFLVEQQHFDLASDVIPDVQYLEEIDPVLMLWDNHDIGQVKTHGLIFETRVGKGRLLVSTVTPWSLKRNPAQRWLISLLLRHLNEGPPPRNALKPETIAAIKNKLREKKLDLVGQAWKFKPDGKNEGVANGWATSAIDDSWKPIKIGQHWEGQGYPNLDGWAWYRLTVTVPKEWAGQPVYWHCDGVDDHAEFYVNGEKVGSMGDLANKKTAFDDKASFDISKLAKPGESITLAVRVFDWYGAGGCHRPQWLSTVPRSEGPEILK